MTALEADFARILDGETTQAETLDFLARSVERMGDPEALTAGARALRERMLRVNAPDGAIDVCGTGGDGAHTLNISTAVAFVVAGAGVPVAKHGNRAASSKSGAADVLEALGVKLTADVAVLERCLQEANIAFLFAQNHHPALRHVAAARREFGQRTIFNLLGPLANPAGVKRQLVGVFAPEYVEPVARALNALGCTRAQVVHGAGGLDELSFAAEGQGAAALVDKGDVELLDIDARDEAEYYGVPVIPIDALRGGPAHENAAALRSLLESKAMHSPYEHAVLHNTAVSLFVAGRVDDALDGWNLALNALRGGAAKQALDSLVAITRQAP
jgi:anthranilate phosphoribosyltransferase